MSAPAATPPRFYLLEPFTLGGFLVHFDTDPGRRYELQFSTNLFNPTAGPAQWTTFYVVDAVPFNNHYIVWDPDTNSVVRAYRLLVEP